MSAATTSRQRELIRLLQAVRDATEAIVGQPDSPAVARWLRHRADCYRRIAAEHPNDSEYPYELAQGAAALDETRAERITRHSEPMS